MHAVQWSGAAQLKRTAEAQAKRKSQEARVHPHDDGAAGLLQGQFLRTSLPFPVSLLLYELADVALACGMQDTAVSCLWMQILGVMTRPQLDLLALAGGKCTAEEEALTTCAAQQADLEKTKDTSRYHLMRLVRQMRRL